MPKKKKKTTKLKRAKPVSLRFKRVTESGEKLPTKTEKTINLGGKALNLGIGTFEQGERFLAKGGVRKSAPRRGNLRPVRRLAKRGRQEDLRQGISQMPSDTLGLTRSEADLDNSLLNPFRRRE